MRFFKRLDHTRALQVAFLFLFLIAVGQVTWWILDQASYASEVRTRLTQLIAADAQAANRFLEQGGDPAAITVLFPHLFRDPASGDLVIHPVVLQSIEDERRRRLNQYGWEGAFFLVVLIGGMAVLAKALHQDAVLRRRQRNFLAAVSHEFKSPLASLQLAAETLSLRDPTPGDRGRLSERMLHDLKRLQVMVSNILETSRIEEGRIALAPERVALAEEADATVEECQVAAADHDVAVEHDIPEGVAINADPVAVRTVLRNLVDNAIKAAGAAGGGKVIIATAVRDGFVDVTVSDNGIGFPPGEAGKLFEKFYRPGNEMRRETRGTGLGLHIVRNLVELGGGKVSAYSDGPGQGARVTVSWIAAHEDDA